MENLWRQGGIGRLVIGAVGVAILAMLLTGCGGKHSSPESAAKAWFDAMSNNKPDRAIAMLHPDDREETSFFRMVITEQAKEVQSQKGRFKIIDSHRDGDTATVLVRATTAKKEVDWMPLRLKRDKGKWYVLPVVFG